MGKLLHIGYAKTGTTTFQKHILPMWGAFAGKHGEQLYDCRLAAISILTGKATSYKPLNSDILSYESLLRPGDLDTFARRTKDHFPYDNVLITIRRQDNIIWSNFIHDLHFKSKIVGRAVSLNERLVPDLRECLFPFCDLKDIPCHCGTDKIISAPFFDFEMVRQVYAKYFNVIVLPMEWMIESPQGFADYLSDTVGLPAIKVPGQLPREKETPKFDRPDMEPVLDLFRGSNRSLQESCPVNLEQWGYY